MQAKVGDGGAHLRLRRGALRLHGTTSTPAASIGTWKRCSVLLSLSSDLLATEVFCVPGIGLGRPKTNRPWSPYHGTIMAPFLPKKSEPTGLLFSWVPEINRNSTAVRPLIDPVSSWARLLPVGLRNPWFVSAAGWAGEPGAPPPPLPAGHERWTWTSLSILAGE